MSSTRPRRTKRTLSSTKAAAWDESNYEPNQDEDEEEEFEEVEEFGELEEGEDDGVDMDVSEVEAGETEESFEEEVELEEMPRRKLSGKFETYEVDSIVQRKFENGREMFLVQWKGYARPTWELRENLDNCSEALDAFFNLVKDANFDSKSDTDSKHEKWKVSIREAFEASQKFDYEIYEKLILRRGLIEVGEGYKIENVPFDNIASRQNSGSSSKG
ncbi:1916_t:CDS:2 [Funneliformis geosporum]|uniref:10041_t:CDS:1 n=1 Tax=Funneliformis geosporum TaxID=1117311 RepID=A0A9W4SEZ1_9GLOM|nr:1916_t:CDS:2 [Funneliformis geosporum]CAI2166089.1 10041_t:CDS:2 [Funneliformis geosporum]